MRVVAGLLLSALVLGSPLPGRAHTQAGEAGLALGAAVVDLVYVPAKIVCAFGGMALGTATGLLTGGDVRAAYAFWVPAGSGTYFLTPAHLDGTRPIEFFGADYADRPSTVSREGEVATAYDALYMPR